jgi:MYXO-CTERM domain-containing protein
MKPYSTRLGLLAAAAAFAAAPVAAFAQEDVKERAAEIAEQANDVQQQAGALANDIAETETAATGDGADRADGEGNTVDDRDGDDGDSGNWGLLGLLGLAGLLGLRRRDHSHAHTDVRRDTRL